MKKKILMVSYRFPWPESEGGYNLRVLNLARILKSKYRLDLLTLFENQNQFRQRKNLKEIFDDVFLIKKTKLNECFGAFGAFFSNSPLQVGYYSSEKMKRWILDNYQKYDLLFLCTLRSLQYIRVNPRVYPRQSACIENIPKAIDLIDSITLNYQEAKKWNNLFWKIIYKIEIPRLKKYEVGILKRDFFGRIFISSEFDKEYLKQLTTYNLQLTTNDEQQEKMVVIPNGVKESLISTDGDTDGDIDENTDRVTDKDTDNMISFLGKMDTQPNQDAAVFFAKEVLPKIVELADKPEYSKTDLDKLKFYIIGPNPTAKVKNLEKIKNVKVTGYLENPYPILEKSRVIVAPLRFGAGIQNKVLEAMALGKAVITSEIGRRGIKIAKEGIHFETADLQNSGLWVEKVIELILNLKKREEIGERAKRLIRENYRWGKIGEKLLEEIKRIIH